MSAKEKKNYSLKDFFAPVIDNSGGLLLVNLIFGGITLAVLGVLVLISYFIGRINLLVLFLIIPLSSPFFGGLFSIAKKLTLDEKLSPVSDFFGGIKPNFVRFFLNSIVVYIIGSGLYFTFSFYRGGLDSPMKITAFVLSVIFTLFFFFVESAMLTMFVGVELSAFEALKNAVFLTIKGFWNHLKTVFSLLFMFVLLFMIVTFSGNYLIAAGVLGVLHLLFLPTLVVYTIVFNNWQTVERFVVEPYNEIRKKEQEAEELAKELDVVFEEAPDDEIASLSDGDPEEYVYVGGRMIKRKNVIKMLDKKAGSDDRNV